MKVHKIKVLFKVVSDDPPALLIPQMFSAIRAAGIDVKEAFGLPDMEKDLAKVTEERNLAIAEAHRLRCELEAARR